MAGASGFDAPADLRADRITADGRTFRYVDSEAIVVESRAGAGVRVARRVRWSRSPGYNTGAIARAACSTARRPRASASPRPGALRRAAGLRPRRRARARIASRRARAPTACSPPTRCDAILDRGAAGRAARARADPPPAGLGAPGDDRRSSTSNGDILGARAHRRRAGLRHRRVGAEGAHRAVLLASRGRRRARERRRRRGYITARAAHLAESSSATTWRAMRAFFGDPAAFTGSTPGRRAPSATCIARSSPTASTPARTGRCPRRIAQLEPVPRRLPARPRLQPADARRAGRHERGLRRAAPARSRPPARRRRPARSCATACRSSPAACPIYRDGDAGRRHRRLRRRRRPGRHDRVPRPRRTPRARLGNGHRQRARRRSVPTMLAPHGRAPALRAVPAGAVHRLEPSRMSARACSASPRRSRSRPGVALGAAAPAPDRQPRLAQVRGRAAARCARTSVNQRRPGPQRAAALSCPPPVDPLAGAARRRAVAAARDAAGARSLAHHAGAGLQAPAGTTRTTRTCSRATCRSGTILAARTHAGRASPTGSSTSPPSPTRWSSCAACRRRSAPQTDAAPGRARHLRARQAAVDVRADAHRRGSRSSRATPRSSRRTTRFRFVPVFNVQPHATSRRSARCASTRAQGTTRNDNHVGVQEAFVDVHLRNVSERYDFDSHPRRHPAVHLGLPRLPVPRRAVRRAPLRHARQQPLAVQPRRGSAASRRTPTRA